MSRNNIFINVPSLQTFRSYLLGSVLNIRWETTTIQEISLNTGLLTLKVAYYRYNVPSELLQVDSLRVIYCQREFHPDWRALVSCRHPTNTFRAVDMLFILHSCRKCKLLIPKDTIVAYTSEIRLAAVLVLMSSSELKSIVTFWGDY
jgi:hypothetical protein